MFERFKDYNKNLLVPNNILVNNYITGFFFPMQFFFYPTNELEQ